MIVLQPYDVYLYLKNKLSSFDPSLFRNGAIDKAANQSIGVFRGSATRDASAICLGGYGCTLVKVLPINILVRWGSDSRVADAKASDVYEALAVQIPNFTANSKRVAYIQLLDDGPISLGRDDKNICEYSIRANFIYYI